MIIMQIKIGGLEQLLDAEKLFDAKWLLDAKKLLDANIWSADSLASIVPGFEFGAFLWFLRIPWTFLELVSWPADR